MNLLKMNPACHWRFIALLDSPSIVLLHLQFMPRQLGLEMSQFLNKLLSILVHLLTLFPLLQLPLLVKVNVHTPDILEVTVRLESVPGHDLDVALPLLRLDS